MKDRKNKLPIGNDWGIPFVSSSAWRRAVNQSIKSLWVANKIWYNLYFNCYKKSLLVIRKYDLTASAWTNLIESIGVITNENLFFFIKSSAG